MEKKEFGFWDFLLFVLVFIGICWIAYHFSFSSSPASYEAELPMDYNSIF